MTAAVVRKTAAVAAVAVAAADDVVDAIFDLLAFRLLGLAFKATIYPELYSYIAEEQLPPYHDCRTHWKENQKEPTKF